MWVCPSAGAQSAAQASNAGHTGSSGQPHQSGHAPPPGPAPAVSPAPAAGKDLVQAGTPPAARAAARTRNAAPHTSARRKRRARLQPQPAAPAATPKAPPRSHGGTATRDCLLLAAAYLFGTALAGALLGLCGDGERQLLRYYLQSWQGFALVRQVGVLRAFCVQYAAAMGLATLVMLLGFCAFGALPIFLAMMLYGTGVGMLNLPALLHRAGPQALAGVVLANLPTAAAVAILCLFGACALQVSARLRSAAFARRQVFLQPAARTLLGQYILVALAFVPLALLACGLLWLAA